MCIPIRPTGEIEVNVCCTRLALNARIIDHENRDRRKSVDGKDGRNIRCSNIVRGQNSSKQ